MQANINDNFYADFGVDVLCTYYTRRLQFAQIITHIDFRIVLSRLEI